jgi:mitochondrial-processing peptidase subunit beta
MCSPCSGRGVGQKHVQCLVVSCGRGVGQKHDQCSMALSMCLMVGVWDKSMTGGRHSGSILTQRIALDELADSFMAFNTNYHDTGLFGVYAVTDGERVEDLSYVVMNELSKLCYEVNDMDVMRARNQLKAYMLFQQENPFGKTLCQMLFFGCAQQ